MLRLRELPRLFDNRLHVVAAGEYAVVRSGFDGWLAGEFIGKGSIGNRSTSERKRNDSDKGEKRFKRFHNSIIFINYI